MFPIALEGDSGGFVIEKLLLKGFTKERIADLLEIPGEQVAKIQESLKP